MSFHLHNIYLFIGNCSLLLEIYKTGNLNANNNMLHKNGFTHSFPCNSSGYHSPPTTCGPRIAFLSFWIFSYLIYTYYTALLTSFLALTTPVKPFETLREVIEHKDWSILTTLHSVPYVALTVSVYICKTK